VETGYLPVIGLRDVMCHVAAVLQRKTAGEVKCGYVITTSTICVNWQVVYSVTKLFQLSNLGWLPYGAAAMQLAKFLSSLDGSRMWAACVESRCMSPEG